MTGEATPCDGYMSGVTERQWYPEDTDDTATQRLPRVQPPLPGSLNPVRRPAADPAPETAPDTAEGESTAELSIDDLMGPTRPARSVAPAAVPPPPPPAAVRPPAPPAAHPAAHAPEPPVPATGPSLTDRLRSDAATAWSAGMRRTQTWLGQGDNAVIVATVLVALLLLVMVAAL